MRGRTERTAARLIKELDAEGIPRVIDPDLTEGDPFWREFDLAAIPSLPTNGVPIIYASRSIALGRAGAASFPRPKAADRARIPPPVAYGVRPICCPRR